MSEFYARERTFEVEQKYKVAHKLRIRKVFMCVIYCRSVPCYIMINKWLIRFNLRIHYYLI